MKRILLGFTTMLTMQVGIKAQNVSDFENLLLPNPPMGSFWNGSDQSGGFSSGGCYFPNFYDTSFGGFWASGFAYSSRIDTVTSGPSNLFSAKAFGGALTSAQYAVAQHNAVARVVNPAPVMIANGFYVTNSTYAFNSMRDGDNFARKFGDTTGTHSGLPQGGYPDFFKLTVRGYFNGMLSPDSVEFYLADYRFANDSLDYIINTWEWVDCSILGAVDSMLFKLSSSDNNSFGMNTPAFFCMDNLTIDYSVGLSEKVNEHEFEVFPNPSKDQVYIKAGVNVTCISYTISNLQGIFITSDNNVSSKQPIDLGALAPGIYFININTGKSILSKKLIKN